MKKIIIGDCKYSVSRLDMNMDVFAVLQDGSQMDDAEQRNVLAKYIYGTIDNNNQQKPSVEFIAEHIDEIIEKNIDAILQNNDYLKEFYNQTKEDEIARKRFFQSIDLYWEHYIEEIKGPLCTLFASCSSIHHSIQEHMDETKDVLIRFSTVLSDWYSEYEIKLAETQKKLEELLQNYDPHAHDADYIAWAKWGWSVIGNAPVSFHLTVPKTKDRADVLAMEYFRTDVQMNILFEETKKYNKCKQNDYEEAIDNFKAKNYKSCVLMLFSLIDGLLINIMEVDRRKPGKPAIENFEKILQGKDEINKGFAIRHWYISVIACLNEVYKRLDRFVVEPNIINRHEIAHGMGNWKVTNKDCVQIFLLYCNILLLIARIDSLEESS